MDAELVFGLVGGFPGDDGKRDAAAQVVAQLRGPESAKVNVQRLLDVLETLPFGGRVEFMLRGVCESPSRDLLMRALFESCFETDAQANSPLAAVGAESTLTLTDYATLRLVTMALPCAGSLGVELFFKYQNTTSTVMFSSFLSAMIASHDFSDEQLEACFIGAVDASRKVIIGLSKSYSHRRAFIARLVEKKFAPLFLLPWANSEAVDALLSSGTPAEVAAYEALGFPNWRRLSTVYMSHFKRRLEAKSNDPIGKGKVFRELEDRAVGLEPGHVAELVSLCVEQKPMEIANSAPPGVRAYLEKLSASGILQGDYEFVSLTFPCDRLLARLHPETKLALLKSHTNTDDVRGWSFSKTHSALCNSLLNAHARRTSKQLIMSFATQVMQVISVDALWDVMNGRKQDDPVIQTFLSVKRFLDFGHWTETRMTGSAIGVWLTMHQRAAPTASILARFAESKTEKQLWTTWSEHAMAPVLAHAKLLAGRALRSLNRCSVESSHSSITSYVGYLAVLLDDLTFVLAAPGQQMDLQCHLAKVAEISDVMSPVILQSVNLKIPASSVGGIRVDAIRKTVETMVQMALERCQDGLVFDPAQGYKNVARHGELAPLLLRLSATPKLSCFPGLRRPAFSLCEHILETSKLAPQAARLGFLEVTSGNVSSFVHFKLALHKAWEKTALEMLAVLRSAFREGKPDDELALRVWNRYKLQRYKGQVPIADHDSSTEFSALPAISQRAWGADKPSDQNSSSYLAIAQRAAANQGSMGSQDFASFLSEFELLPASIVALEKPESIRISIEKLLESDRAAVPLLARLGWLLEVLQGCGEDLSSRRQILLAHGQLGEHSDVREILEAQTSGPDPAARIQGHLNLLTKSLKNLSELAVTFTYVAQRTKNEAGLHRPQLYQWMNQNIVTIVALSLTAEGAKADVQTICDSLERMLKDDTSKRDSVAKSAFQKMAALIFSTALTWDLSRPEIDIRRQWLDCAVKLECTVLKVLHGEDAADAYVWPQNVTLSRERTFPEQWLAEYRAFFVQHFRAGSNRFDEFRIAVYSHNLQLEEGHGPRFDVVDAVDLVLGSVGAPWEPATRRVFPEPVPGSELSTLLRRTQVLFKIAGTRWPEVPKLVQFLASTVEALDDCANRLHHVRQVHLLFEEIRGLYTTKQLWYEIELLAKTCERLFTASINLKLASVARSLRPFWTELKMNRGLSPIGIALGEIQLSRMVAEVPSLGSFVLLESSPHSSPSAAERLASSACELLTLDRSAAYVVSADLLSVRDDLLLKYVHQTRGELHGVFDPSTTVLKETQRKLLAPITVDSSMWGKLSSSTMRVYTEDSLAEALNPSVSPYERSAAIGRFVTSPASSNAELIRVLRQLTSKSGEDDDDQARSLLLETITLRVFETDAAWFVLAYLLSPEVISSSSSRRTTASILTNLHSWVPMDKVVAVLSVLLEKDRRGALTVFLHKSIIRMLFESASMHEGARNLFSKEWSNRKEMHPDIIHDMVRLAVGALGDADSDSPKMRAAWEIIDEVAQSEPDTFGPLTVMLLLLPKFSPPPSSLAGLEPLDDLLRINVPNPTPDVDESFGVMYQKFAAPQTPISFSSSNERERMITVMRAVAKSSGSLSPFLRVMATLKEFTFSRFALGIDDDEALGAMQKLILAATIQWPPKAWTFPTSGSDAEDVVFALAPEDDFFLQVASRMFASFGAQLIGKELQKFTAHERSTKPDLLKEVCSRLNVAMRLRGVMELLLEAMARVAPIDVEKCVRLSRVAEGMMAAIRSRGFAAVLFEQHFRGALAFLRRNNQLLIKFV